MQTVYVLHNWQILETDIRNQILSKDATPIEKTKFGQIFEIKGELFGPNGKSLSVITIWITEDESRIAKFITMYPDKRRK